MNRPAIIRTAQGPAPDRWTAWALAGVLLWTLAVVGYGAAQIAASSQGGVW